MKKLSLIILMVLMCGLAIAGTTQISPVSNGNQTVVVNDNFDSLQGGLNSLQGLVTTTGGYFNNGVLNMVNGGTGNVGIGTTGQVLTSDGSGSSYWSTISSSTCSYYFTGGSYTWTAPANIYYVRTTITGAGGSGSSSRCSPDYSGAGGGAGGSLRDVLVSVTPGNSYSVVVGAKGVRSGSDACNQSDGTDGTNTTFNGLTAYAGTHGIRSFSSPTGGTGGSYAGSYVLLNGALVAGTNGAQTAGGTSIFSSNYAGYGGNGGSYPHGGNDGYDGAVIICY